MVNARHSRYTVNQGIHGFISFEYANEAARLAASGFIAEDKYKAAIETDTKNIYVITDVINGIATWEDIHTFGGGDSGNAVHGSILYFNGTTWVSLDPGDDGYDGYVLTTHGEGDSPTWEPSSGGVQISAGAQSVSNGLVVFSNSNGINFGMNNSTITAIYTVPTQTNQTLGLYAVGNTTQNSSTILDARTLSFNGLGAATLGFSNGSVQISVPVQTVQTQSIIQGIYDGANSISTGTIRFTNANGVSFSINGQTISGSVSQSNQTLGLYAVGNTTQNSSTTLDARTLSFNGLGAASIGYSNGTVQVSAPDVSQISATGGLSLSVNASTISLGVPYNRVSHMAWPPSPWQTHFGISNASFSLQHFNPQASVTASQANFLLSLSGNSGSSGALTISVGIYTISQSTMSLVSSDSAQISWTSGSDTSASSRYGGVSGARYRAMTLNGWQISPGDYMVGIWFRTTNDGTWRAYGQQGPTIVGALASNETNHYLNGYSTSSFTTAMVATINVTNTNYVRTGAEALQHPSIIYLGSI